MEEGRRDFQEGNYASAEPKLRQALEGIADVSAQAECIDCLTSIYGSWGKFSEALRLFQQLTISYAQSPGDNVEPIAVTLEKASGICAKIGQERLSENLATQARYLREGKITPQSLIPKPKPPEAAVEPPRDLPPPVAPIAHPGRIAEPQAPLPPANPMNVPQQENPNVEYGHSSGVARQPHHAPQAPQAQRPASTMPPPQQQQQQSYPQQQQFAPQRPAQATPPQSPPQQQQPYQAPRKEPKPLPPPQRPASAMPEQPGWGPPAQQQSGQHTQQQAWPSQQQSGQHAQQQQAWPTQQQSGQHFQQQQAWPSQQQSGQPSQQQSPPAQAPSRPASEPHAQTAPAPADMDAGDSGKGGKLRGMDRGEAAAPRGLRGMEAGAGPKPESEAGGNPVQKLFYGLHSAVSGKKATHEAVQQLEDPAARSRAQALSMLASIAILVILVFSAYKFMPRKLTVQEAFMSMPHKYRSADSLKMFQMVDTNTCEFVVLKNRQRFPYRMYLDDWRDAIDLAVGQLGQKQSWFYRTEDGIIDHDGNTLYVADGPESKLVSKVEVIGQYAKLCYLQNQKYPDKPDLLSSFNLEYENPFSPEKEIEENGVKKMAHEKELPSFQSWEVGQDLNPTQADKARSGLYNDLLFGGKWIEPKDPHPGQIRCAAITFNSPRGNIQAFVVQILDARGKPLSGSFPTSSYFFALEDGKDYVEKELPQMPYKGQSGMRQIMPWIFFDKLDPNLAFMIKNGPLVALSGLAFLFLALCFTVPAGIGRFITIVLFLGTLLPAVMFLLSKYIP